MDLWDAYPDLGRGVSGDAIRMLSEASRGFLAGSHDGRWLVTREGGSPEPWAESGGHAML